MGVHVVVLAANQGELGVRHLPALATLAQCLRQALAHVVLIPVGQLLLLDDGLKLDAAAPGQGLHQQAHHSPAGLGGQVDLLPLGGRGRRLLVNHRGLGEGHRQAVPLLYPLGEHLQLDFPRDAQVQLPAFGHPLQVQQGVLLGELLQRLHQGG